MWKWLGGCLLLCVVLMIVLFWWSMKSIQQSVGPDGSIAVNIAAPPERVFASLSTGDSLSAWMGEGGTLIVARRGRLQPGDVLRVRIRGTKRDALSWQVTQVIPNQLIVFDMRSDSTGVVVATRYDSVSVAGDSTRVSSRLVSPLLDRSAPSADENVTASDGMADVTSRLLVSMIRIQSKAELTRLKARVEGTAASR